MEFHHMGKTLSPARMALALLSVVGTVAAQTPPAGGGPPAFNPVGKAYLFPDFKTPTVTVKYPGNVEATFDNTYSTIQGYRPLMADVYRVPNAGPKPAIIFIHGGSYIGGSPRYDRDPVYGEMDGLMAYVASRGYVVIPISYRLAFEAKWPAQLLDAKAAVRWARANAGKFGIDPQRIGVWGVSAGAHIAALAGATCNIAEFDSQPPPAQLAIARTGPSTPPGGGPAGGPPGGPAKQVESACVQAAVVWYGATDFAALDSQAESYTRLVHNGPNSSQSRLLGCSINDGCDKATMERASAFTYLDKGATGTAFLFQAGDRDEAIPWKQSQMMNDALRAKGITSQVDIVSGANHYFQGASKEQAKQVLDTFFKFLDENLTQSARK
jgi:acetyl esterase/lipase